VRQYQSVTGLAEPVKGQGDLVRQLQPDNPKQPSPTDFASGVGPAFLRTDGVARTYYRRNENLEPRVSDLAKESRRSREGVGNAGIGGF